MIRPGHHSRRPVVTEVIDEPLDRLIRDCRAQSAARACPVTWAQRIQSEAHTWGQQYRRARELSGDVFIRGKLERYRFADGSELVFDDRRPTLKTI